MYEVRPGDTLHKIASETKPDGVSLEQMLVGLLRANQEAFDGGNMNRLKAAKTLSVPEAAALETVTSAAARKIVVAQSSDWNAYRNRLAAETAQGPVKEDLGKHDASGRITAKVDAPSGPVFEAKDKVRISRTEPVGTHQGATAKRYEEDMIAKDKALQEATDRRVMLEKNISSLQALIELKNAQLAELEKQTGAKAMTPDALAAPKHIADVIPASFEPGAATSERSAASSSNPPEPKPVVKAELKRATPPTTVPEAPGLFEELLGSPLVLAGSALLILFAGYGLYKRRR